MLLSAIILLSDTPSSQSIHVTGIIAISLHPDKTVAALQVEQTYHFFIFRISIFLCIIK